MLERGNTGDERVMGRHGVGVRNEQGGRVINFAESFDMEIVSTFFTKSTEQKITYTSGQHRTQIDYILYRRGLHKR